MVNKDQLAAQNLIIEELRLMIVKLQERVKELEDKKVTQETRKFHIDEATSWSRHLFNSQKGRPTQELQSNILNAVGNEQAARKRKEHSVIVFGMPPAKPGTPEEEQKDDETNIATLFNSIHISTGEIKQVRRFKSKTNQTSPMQVIFKDDGYTSIEIIKAAKKLRDTAIFKTVYINLDLTATQQIQLKQLLTERNEKNKALAPDPDFRYGIRGDKVVRITITRK